MNPSSLSPLPPDLPVAAARAWLSNLQSLMRRDSGATWEQGLDSCRPAGVLPAASVDFTRWADENGLREPLGSGWTVSMKGVGFILSHDRDRLGPEEAWEHASHLLAKAQWINQAPPELAPMKVVDVLLFGSMAKPSAADHGDMDVLLVLQSKESGASTVHETFLRDHGLLPDRGWYSYRRELESLLEASDPFVSAIVSAQPIQTLLDQDPGFSAFSLMGCSWTEGRLEQTTVDEEAYAVMKALENGNGHPAWKAHVSRRLQFPSSSTSLAERACSGVIGNPEVSVSSQVTWASGGPFPAVALPLREHALDRFGASENPLAKKLLEAWRSAPLITPTPAGPRP